MDYKKREKGITKKERKGLKKKGINIIISLRIFIASTPG